MPPVRPGGALGPCGTTPDPPPAVFFECFAGAGNLSAELATYGVQVVVDEVAQGGTNFLDELAVSKLQENIERQVASGLRVALHLAPPCSTFSRARDRSRKTRLRSAEFPAGLPRCADQVKDANSVALAAFDLAVWASQLGFWCPLRTRGKVIFGISWRRGAWTRLRGRTTTSARACTVRGTRSRPHCGAGTGRLRPFAKCVS